jgi:hypothetical protein
MSQDSKNDSLGSITESAVMLGVLAGVAFLGVMILSSMYTGDYRYLPSGVPIWAGYAAGFVALCGGGGGALMMLAFRLTK